jgi:hypothetical protein
LQQSAAVTAIEQQSNSLYPTQTGHFAHHNTSPQPSPIGAGQFNQISSAYHQQQQQQQQQPTQRVLTSSTSFDSKAQIPVFSYQMSAEAAKLFATLQQSPLPIPQTDVINYC